MGTEKTSAEFGRIKAEFGVVGALTDLIRFKLMGDNGQPIPGHSTDMPKPGETVEDAIRRIRAEFGGRLLDLKVIDDGNGKNT